jgi:hypothetical protein
MLSAIVLLLVGLMFPLLLNGQTFTNSIIGICFLVGSAVMSVCDLARTDRYAAPFKVFLGLAVLLILILLIRLPTEYAFQTRFNQRREDARQRDLRANADVRDL